MRHRRAYTCLLQRRDGHGPRLATLLVKVHEHGRCSQALARLRVGDCIEMRGPVVTDADAHQRLFGPDAATPRVPMGGGLEASSVSQPVGGEGAAPRASIGGTPPPPLPPPAPPAVAAHFLSAGSGLAPMLQLCDALLSAREEGSSGGASGYPAANQSLTQIRFWSVARHGRDALLPEWLAEQQARACHVPALSIACTHIFTRERTDRPPPADPCAAYCGTSAVVVGRPHLPRLLMDVPAAEVRDAVLVICGPDAFNASMRASAIACGYRPESVFVRDTPPPQEEGPSAAGAAGRCPR